MSATGKTLGIFLAIATVLAVPLMDQAWARAGGGRSSGSRGSRSYASPSRTYSSSPSASSSPSSSPSYGQPGSSTPYSSPLSQTSAGGGFWRSMAGGVVGGMLGGMLFRSLGFGGGWGGGFGGGIGLLDVVLLAGIGFVVFRLVRGRRGSGSSLGTILPMGPQAFPGGQSPYGTLASGIAPGGGLQGIARTDPNFEESAFREWATDAFFRIQGAWMHRDLDKLRPLMTEEMKRGFERDIGELKARGQTNRLENITVRSVEVTEAWQEDGQDYVTVRYLANLLDYSVDDASGKVLSGSDTDPVKFEEFWTWVRSTGPNDWKLSAINQAE